MKFKQAMILPCALLLTNCGGADSKNGNSEVEGMLEGEIDSAVSDGWAFSQSVDPMNDSKLATAKKSIDSGAFTVEAELTCANESNAYFAFKFFDKGGSEAPLNVRIGQRPFGGGPIEVVYVQARADSRRPSVLNAVGMRSINELRLDLTDHYLIAGQSIMFRFPLINGDATIQINVTDSVVQRVMAPCAKEVREALAVDAEPINHELFPKEMREKSDAFAAKREAQDKLEEDARIAQQREEARQMDLESGAAINKDAERGRQAALEDQRQQEEQIKRAYAEQE